MNHCSRLPRLLVSVVGVLLVVLVSGLFVAGTTVGADANGASESSGAPDPQVGREGCRLMGRVYVAGGCSRTRCAHAGESIRLSPNAETCLIGGRSGSAYGTEVEFRVCEGLHRRWVAAVNFCASNPHRGETLLPHARQCRAPYTTYVTTSRIASRRATLGEAEGRYDVCVRPGEAAKLAKLARKSGADLRTLAVQSSSTLCALQPHHVFTAGRCVQETAIKPATVLMVGDSLTWRGTDELAARRPDWVIDGQSGRNLGALSSRIGRFELDRGAPTGLVVALGTNPAKKFDLAKLRAVVATLPAETPVMVVLPYRSRQGNSGDQVDWVNRSVTMLETLVAERPHTCTSDWRGFAQAHPGDLVDGTHQTHRAENIWADIVSSAWDSCLAAG